MVPTVTCDPRGQDTFSRGDVYILGAAEDHDPTSLPGLVLDRIGWCGRIGFSICERARDFRVDRAKYGDRRKWSGQLLVGLLSTMRALPLSADAVIAAFEDLVSVMVTDQSSLKGQDVRVLEMLVAALKSPVQGDQTNKES